MADRAYAVFKGVDADKLRPVFADAVESTALARFGDIIDVDRSQPNALKVSLRTPFSDDIVASAGFLMEVACTVEWDRSASHLSWWLAETIAAKSVRRVVEILGATVAMSDGTAPQRSNPTFDQLYPRFSDWETDPRLHQSRSADAKRQGAEAHLNHKPHRTSNALMAILNRPAATDPATGAVAKHRL
jgi:hypothetical protein